MTGCFSVLELYIGKIAYLPIKLASYVGPFFIVADLPIPPAFSTLEHHLWCQW
jgi:hypothetical protein